ncbi:MAG: hypothetical protein HY898_10170 [Deltaproteobacteria bacterium]|nr:hypothetical protein [Deltaproteobacteria bacterium]
MTRALSTCCFALSLAACGYRPVRFVDAPPVSHADDESPVPMPKPDPLEPKAYLADVYLRRPIMDALDAARIPDAGDVNSIDEVPGSSWFVADRAGRSRLSDYAVDGPPRSPLRVTGGLGADTLSIADARGLPYRMRADVVGRPEMRTAADAIASRLLWAIGYITPEVHVVHIRSEDFPADRGQVEHWLQVHDPRQSSHRMAATRWPIGTDLGAASATFTRADDPNDQVPHVDRRTLRGLRVLGAWLDFKTMGPQKTLDAYVGAPGCGHVVHYLAGFEDTLGADKVSSKVAKGALHPDCGGNPFLNLVTLGLQPDPPPSAMERKYHAIGSFEEEVHPERYRPELPPYEPLDHTLPSDGFWASRRMMGLGEEQIRWAVEGGGFTQRGTAAHLVHVLEVRRRAVAAWWTAQVSPLVLEGVEGLRLQLHDYALVWGLAAAGTTSYRAEFLDARGAESGASVRLEPRTACWEMELPQGALAPYLIVRITALRGAFPKPRPAQFHLMIANGNARLVGVRH